MKAGKKIISVMASLMTLSGLSPLALLYHSLTRMPSFYKETSQSKNDEKIVSVSKK